MNPLDRLNVSVLYWLKLRRICLHKLPRVAFQAMFGALAAHSQAPSFCWDAPWTSQLPLSAQPATQAGARRCEEGGVAIAPPLQPHSKSGAAAVARLVAAAASAADDAFSFDGRVTSEPLHEEQPAKLNLPGTGWRGRTETFLRSNQELGHCAKRVTNASCVAAQQSEARNAKQRAAAHCTQPTATAVAAPSAVAALAPAATTLTLDRYLEFWQLLTKGTGEVQMLSELEKSILKASDLKQILLINGMNSGSRTKKEILDRLSHLRLWSPWFDNLQTFSQVEHHAEQQPVAVDKDALGSLSSLGWVPPSACEHGSKPCMDSCCSLPTLMVHLRGTHAPEGAPAEWSPVVQRAADTPAPSQPAISPPGQQAVSDTTLASLDAAAHLHLAVQCSPGVEQHQPAAHAGRQSGNGSAAVKDGTGSRTPAVGTQEQPPAWLAQGITRVSLRSQGSKEHVLPSSQLQGRRVCFVLLEEFDQDDPGGITDSLDAGVLEGQVVEPVGVDHDADCPPGCRQRHAFHYVRVRAHRSTAPPHRRAGRRLDLVVDLQPGLRYHELGDLLRLGDEELQDAWVLLEPRAEGAEVGGAAWEHAPTQMPSGAATAFQPAPSMPTSGAAARAWGTKRGAHLPVAAPSAKRQQALGTTHAP